jgi:hypothetical protein
VRGFGIVALVTGSIALVLGLLAATLLIGPVVFWLAWNVLDFGPAVGLPELGFWGIVLATLFLALGWMGKMAVVAVVFLADPGWFHGTAELHWPEPTLRNFVALALLLAIATRPRANRSWDRRSRRRSSSDWYSR